MDGDGQHSADVIPDLVQPLRSFSADIVSAARKLDDPSDGAALSPARTKMSRLGNWLCQILLRRQVSDPPPLRMARSCAQARQFGFQDIARDPCC
jgi:hypothetical protein